MSRRPDWTPEEALHALLDGELPEESRVEVEQQLASNPDLAVRYGAYQQQNKALHALFDPVLDEPVPERVRPAVLAQGRRHRLTRAFGRLAASLLLLLLGGAGGWLLNEQLSEDVRFETMLTREATNAHRIFAAEARHAVEVTAEEDEHLFRWLSNRLGGPVKAPPLGDFGFALVGGRLLPCDDGDPGVAAQFMYEDGDGRRLTLYVTRYPNEADSGFEFVRRDGLSTFYWVENGFAYALIGSTGRDLLLQVAESVHSALTGQT